MNDLSFLNIYKNIKTADQTGDIIRNKLVCYPFMTNIF